MALKHKGYFYSMDAFIAMIIVAVGVFVVMQAQSKELPRTSVFLLADDLSNYLTHTKIYDLNEDYYPDSIKAWKQNQTIAHIDNTLLQKASLSWQIHSSAMSQLQQRRANTILRFGSTML